MNTNYVTSIKLLIEEVKKELEELSNGSLVEEVDSNIEKVKEILQDLFSILSILKNIKFGLQYSEEELEKEDTIARIKNTIIKIRKETE